MAPDKMLEYNPANIRDKKIWERAKKIAIKQYGSPPPWPVVMHIYKNMGGRFTHKNPSDFLPGGRADDMLPENFDPIQLRIGMKHEREHTDDDDIAREIAMDHLAEDPNYYTKLSAIENPFDYYDATGVPLKQVLNRWVKDSDKAYDEVYMVTVKEIWPYREYTWTSKHHRGGAIPVGVPYGKKWEYLPGVEDGIPEEEVADNRFLKLKEYMAEHGWSPKDPAHLKFGKNGKILLGEGNHRLAVARELGAHSIPVRYHFYQEV